MLSLTSAALSLLLAAAVAPAPAGELDVRIDGVRSDRGVLHLCLTREPAHFPDCGKDPRALKRSIESVGRTVRFTGLEPGGYALSIFHDENSNGRLDTLLGIPREGFGFSRNPVVRFGPPRFDQVRLNLTAGISRQTVRMQYML